MTVQISNNGWNWEAKGSYYSASLFKPLNPNPTPNISYYQFGIIKCPLSYGTGTMIYTTPTYQPFLDLAVGLNSDNDYDFDQSGSPIYTSDSTCDDIIIILRTRKGTGSAGIGFVKRDTIPSNWNTVITQDIIDALKPLNLQNLIIELSRPAPSQIYATIKFNNPSTNTIAYTVYP